MACAATLHYSETTMYKAQKALITAKFNGLDIQTKKFDPAKDGKSAEFRAKNPTGKVPYLETDMGCISTSNAVARYLAKCRADTSIYGTSFAEEGAIDTWMEFCIHELEVPLMTWVYPTLGLLEDDAQVTADAKSDVKKALTKLEATLAKSTYLIGNFVSLADIAVVCGLLEGFRRVFDPAFRKGFPKVCAWFAKCCAVPQFKAVLGDVVLCTQAEKPKAVAAPAKSAPAPKAESKKAEAKPAAKPAAAAPAPKAASAPAAASGDVDAQVKAVGDQIRELKTKLKGEGLSGKQVDNHEEVKSLVAKLQELKAAAAAGGSAAPAKAAAPAPAAAAPAAPAAAPAGGDVQAQVDAVGNQIRALKEKLKGEGLSGKKINDHAEVKELVAKLQDLKAQLA
mmetsp:Transcript_30311/g.70721  ORF Transcript_30311/g.70721 Transcript_30311/m.70721 type:complete len:396 (-) Transcript_30311:21-1208(-)